MKSGSVSQQLTEELQRQGVLSSVAKADKTEFDMLLLQLDKSAIKKLAVSQNPYGFLLNETSNDPEVRHVSHNKHSGKHYVSVSILYPDSKLKNPEIWKTFFAYADTLELAALKCYSQWKGIASDAPF